MKPMQLLALLSIACLAASALGDPPTSQPVVPVTISIDAQAPRTKIPSDFLGVSMETRILLPNEQGQHMLRPDNARLIELFKLLGINSLRIGGNTADNPAVNVPANADIDSLFGFAESAGTKVIYTLRLRQPVKAEDDAAIAKYVASHYRSQLTCFAIGNEPNVFAKTYPAYLDQLKQFMAAITAADCVPDATFCGPSTTPGRAAWARDLATDLGKTGKLAFITQHVYPGGSATKITDPATAQDQMLSREWVAGYEKMQATFAPTAAQNGLSYRLEETNSYFHGGVKGASDSFASALWALDYMYWWVAHQCAGLNFHTGDVVAVGDGSKPAAYAVWTTSPGGYRIHPIGYAFKAFSLTGGGELEAVQTEPKDALKLSSYAVAGRDGNTYVTLINKEHGAAAKGAAVTVTPGPSLTKAQTISLLSAGNDLAATASVTLGGGELKEDVSWSGDWTALSPSAGGRFTIDVPASTAVVVQFSPR